MHSLRRVWGMDIESAKIILARHKDDKSAARNLLSNSVDRFRTTLDARETVLTERAIVLIEQAEECINEALVVLHEITAANHSVELAK